MAGGQEQWQAHAQLIGRVTLSWNHAVHQLLRVFALLTGLPHSLCAAIFFSHQSDKAQRGLVWRVAGVVELQERDRAKLKKLLDGLEKVSRDRNLAAHTIFGLSMFDPETSAWSPTVVPALLPNPDHRLEKDFTAQFNRADRTLKKIYQDLEDWLLHAHIPDRPWDTPPFLGYVPSNIPEAAESADDPTF